MNSEARRIGLFLIVGGLSTVFNYFVFWICLDGLHVFYLISNWIGYFAGVCLGFSLNARYTFEMGRQMTGRHPVLYATVYLLSLALSTLTLYGLVSFLEIPPKIANILAIVQSTVTNYAGCKYVVFRKNPSCP